MYPGIFIGVFFDEKHFARLTELDLYYMCVVYNLLNLGKVRFIRTAGCDTLSHPAVPFLYANQTGLYNGWRTFKDCSLVFEALLNQSYITTWRFLQRAWHIYGFIA